MGKINLWVLLSALIAIVPTSTLGRDIGVPDPDWNKLSACHPNVQSSIINLQKIYGNFSFLCNGGFLIELSSSSYSPVFKESPKEFIANHWELFISSKPKHSLEIIDGNQQYKGFPVYGRYAHNDKDYYGKNTTACFFSVVDTSLWNFEPKFKFDCSKAIDLARKHDEGAGIKGDWDYKCYPKYAVIGDNIFPDGPALVWAVEATKRPKGDQPGISQYSFRILRVDVDSGRVCDSKQHTPCPNQTPNIQ